MVGGYLSGVINQSVSRNKEVEYGRDIPIEKKDELILSNKAGFGLKADVGLTKRIDTYFRFPTSSAPSVGFKLQLIGSPLNKLENGLKASAAIEYGESYGSINPLSKMNFFSNSVNSTMSVFSSSIIIGYRVNPKILPYSYFSYSYYKAHGEISDNNTIVVDNSVANKSYAYVIGLFYRPFSNEYSLSVELGNTHNKFMSNQHKKYNQVAVSLITGYYWH